MRSKCYRSDMMFWVCWVSGVLTLWRAWASANLFCGKIIFCVYCSVCFLPYQSVRQFTGAGCLGRARNSGAWGVGKLMQLGFERGKKLCVRESECVRDGVYAGKWTICLHAVE